MVGHDLAHSGRGHGGGRMIRVERNPAFWVDVASHPALTGALYGLHPDALTQIVGLPQVVPLAAQHGGFLFNRLDVFGFVYELHTLFTPEGWGREVVEAGHEALETIFGLGPVAAIVTAQMADNSRSQPPRSFGFVPCAHDWANSALGSIKPWLLTRPAWEQSPARKRRLS